MNEAWAVTDGLLAGEVYVGMDSDPCYGEDCSGCCSHASDFMSIAEATAFRDQITAAIDKAATVKGR